MWALEINLRAILIDSEREFEASQLVIRVSISHFSPELLCAAKLHNRKERENKKKTNLQQRYKEKHCTKNLPRATFWLFFFSFIRCTKSCTRHTTQHNMEIFFRRVPYLIITSSNKFYLILVMIMYGTQVIFISTSSRAHRLYIVRWATGAFHCLDNWRRCDVLAALCSQQCAYLFAMKCWNKHKMKVIDSHHDWA